ncbi:Zinc finger MYND domain-containing 19 Q7TSV3 [Chlorella sorokiniana]|uniref:Zinc finger MYND domain-containing 19 Q7TSV3 n=1 Tax=Chlorella sorokiniana TaxID=3076 RepID=A0A2P6U103_CHLSO|nr:Zinc finger MYND domain-containing 19 Q7TSV3 [Chlorella sorokiniana]|eukprot:PRW59997.1 Zinc finger MYND domain-containing 19 Q7TSV3 [Chlorella sorokiniana]
MAGAAEIPGWCQAAVMALRWLPACIVVGAAIEQQEGGAAAAAQQQPQAQRRDLMQLGPAALHLASHAASSSLAGLNLAEGAWVLLETVINLLTAASALLGHDPQSASPAETRCLCAMSAAYGQALLACVNACDARGIAVPPLHCALIVVAGITTVAVWSQNAVLALLAWWRRPEAQAAAALELAQAAAARSCAYLRCANLGGEGGPAAGQGVGSQRCSACRAVWYCGTACSHADWRAGHRRVCRALGVARAAEKERRRQAGDAAVAAAEAAAAEAATADGEQR